MSFRSLSSPVVFALSTLLLAVPALAQTHPTEPASPYGGQVVERIIARVNDQIITQSDYDRALKDMDDELHQHGATMQQISEAHRDLLRNMIDQQLWLSKGKELGITGETELVNRLDQIRKQYNLASLEDLEKAAQQQGVSFEDFKQNIRNQLITQEVMRQEVGAHINFTPGEVQRYYQEHQSEYQQPETVKLSEILIPTPQDGDDPAKVAAAEAKANDVEAKLKGGADFAELARTESAGQTAAQGGDLGTYRRGQLGASVFEDATFSLPSGGVTQPIRTRQGFVIFKVNQHNPAGIQPFKDVEQQVEQDYYESKMEPAIRDELNKMRDDAYLEIDQRDGFADTGATGNKRINPISYAAYTPPTPKKKKKVERTRFRENAHFRSKTTMPTLEKASAETKPAKKAKQEELASEKPGRKEKIRFGQAPTKTLPSEPQSATEDAGAGSQVATAAQPSDLVQEATPVEHKTRFSDRARVERQEKKEKQGQPHTAKTDALAPAPPGAAEVADQQTQSASLGLNGDSSKKKKASTTTAQKTRLSDRNKDQKDQHTEPQQPTPIPAVQGAPPAQGSSTNPPPQP